jgi:hypothetical protein
MDTGPDGLLISGAVPGVEGGTGSGAGFSVSFDTRDVCDDGQLTPRPSCDSVRGRHRHGALHRRPPPLPARPRRPRARRTGLPSCHHRRRPVFNLLPRVGGSYLMRGTLHSRYRDRHMMAGQAEYRLHVWRRVGIDALVGAGQVAPRLEQPVLSSPPTKARRPSPPTTAPHGSPFLPWGTLRRAKRIHPRPVHRHCIPRGRLRRARRRQTHPAPLPRRFGDSLTTHGAPHLPRHPPPRPRSPAVPPRRRRRLRSGSRSRPQ